MLTETLPLVNKLEFVLAGPSSYASFCRRNRRRRLHPARCRWLYDWHFFVQFADPERTSEPYIVDTTACTELHGIKFQSVIRPNGPVFNLDGTWEGWRHDAGICLKVDCWLHYPIKCRHLVSIFDSTGTRPIRYLSALKNRSKWEPTLWRILKNISMKRCPVPA